jgi:hypothetical protein
MPMIPDAPNQITGAEDLREIEAIEDRRRLQAVERLTREPHEERDRQHHLHRRSLPGEGEPLTEGRRHVPRVRDAGGARRRPPRFRHHDREECAERDQRHATGHDRQLQGNEPQRHRQHRAGDRRGEPHLPAAQEKVADGLLADLIGDPGFDRAGQEGGADAPDHLAREHRGEGRDRAFQRESAADEHEPEHDRELPAVTVGHDTGWHLENETDRFQQRADQHELQRIQANRRGLVDHVDGENRHCRGGIAAGQQVVDRGRGSG